MTEWQSSQDDSDQQGVATTSGGVPGQRPDEAQPYAQPLDGQPLDGEQQQYEQPQYQQVQPYVPQQAAGGAWRQYATGLTPAQQVWYTLSCIAMGAGYFAKIPSKKALSDFGMAELTSAEQFWYTFMCIAFGAGYFKKLGTAKALSEMPQFRQAPAASRR